LPPHHLRAGRRRRAAGEELPENFLDEFVHHIEHKKCLVVRGRAQVGKKRRGFQKENLEKAA